MVWLWLARIESVPKYLLTVSQISFLRGMKYRPTVKRMDSAIGEGIDSQRSKTVLNTQVH